jgi:hypothetical protein
MTERRKPRPRDPVQLGKLIVDIATGQVEDREPEASDPSVVAQKRRAGLKGGRARAETLSPSERADIARMAAGVRWRKGES